MLEKHNRFQWEKKNCFVNRTDRLTLYKHSLLDFYTEENIFSFQKTKTKEKHIKTVKAVESFFQTFIFLFFFFFFVEIDECIRSVHIIEFEWKFSAEKCIVEAHFNDNNSRKKHIFLYACYEFPIFSCFRLTWCQLFISTSARYDTRCLQKNHYSAILCHLKTKKKWKNGNKTKASNLPLSCLH